MIEEIKNVAIIFGKEDQNSFNRYTFPIMGRPVAAYPLLAALYSEKIDRVYLSSDSPGLLNIGNNLEGIKILKRESSQPTLTEEVRLAVKLVIKDLGEKPETVTILLANSPCVEAKLIDETIELLEDNESYDSAATAMKRSEFNPVRIFSLDSENKLVKNNTVQEFQGDAYFLDRRVMTVRTDIILDSMDFSNYFEGLLGKNIIPIVQQDGIWDIDYIWQVPIVERWLRQNGFDDSNSPYDKNKVVEKKWKIFSQSESKQEIEGEKFKILITTVPFGMVDSTPLNLLNNETNVEYIINPIGRKLKEYELAELIHDYDILIAGTEPITRKVLERAKKLKLISRVGIGLDSVDLNAARDFGIKVSYTPDAPSPAVAELTIAHIINLLRKVPLVDRKLRSGIWQRIHGERLANMVVGVIGIGRVGSRVLKHLQGFNPKSILVNDLNPNYNLYEMYNAKFTDKEKIYKEADIITLHVPLTPLTHNMISYGELNIMKNNALLVNTSRGGIVNEKDLYDALSSNRIAGAAIDVFENEPYTGGLTQLDNCYLSCHMGSMTNDCRSAMEILATEEALRFIRNEPLKGTVPEEEYSNLVIIH